MGQADVKVRSLQCQRLSCKSLKVRFRGDSCSCVRQATEEVLDCIIPGLTVLLRQAGMQCHPAHPLLAPLQAIDHPRQVSLQNASLSFQSSWDQWLRTILLTASCLLQNAVGKQLRQETWVRHVAAEAIPSK